MTFFPSAFADEDRFISLIILGAFSLCRRAISTAPDSTVRCAPREVLAISGPSSFPKATTISATPKKRAFLTVDNNPPVH